MFQRGENWLKSGGNKRGRPRAGKSLAEYIRGKTKDGKELANFYYKVWKDDKEPTEIRMRAAEKLEFRAYGAEKLEFRAYGRYAQPITGDPAEPVSIILNVDPLAK